MAEDISRLGSWDQRAVDKMCERENERESSKPKVVLTLVVEIFILLFFVPPHSSYRVIHIVIVAY